MLQTKWSRRKLLKLGGGILAAAPFIHAAAPAFAEDPAPVIVAPRRPFGRVTASGLSVRELPSIKAKRVGSLKLNEIIAVKGVTTSDESPTAYNKLWYQTDDGFVYSAYVQPAENTTYTPVEIDSKGIWGEISVPFTDVHSAPSAESSIEYRTYFGCVFKIISSVTDANKAIWYQIADEYSGYDFYVNAEHVRPIPRDEFAPISPDVPAEEKRVEVDLKNQMVTAYEADKSVFTARVATGASFHMTDGTVQDFSTPKGNHRVYMKLPSQHMVGGAAGDADFYDLPGICWISYFVTRGIAFHGTYWHNDYGTPRSHGCVNMLPEDAKWIYMWTLPTGAYDDRHTTAPSAASGTLIKVI
jgi:lipoprotein-anchoring transpeptidase ErfK/SrfK